MKDTLANQSLTYYLCTVTGQSGVIIDSTRRDFILVYEKVHRTENGNRDDRSSFFLTKFVFRCFVETLCVDRLPIIGLV